MANIYIYSLVYTLGVHVYECLEELHMKLDARRDSRCSVWAVVMLCHTCNLPVRLCACFQGVAASPWTLMLAM